MSNTKHTPGPWHVYNMGNYFGIDAGNGNGYGPDDRTIVTFGDADDDLMGVRGDTYEEMKANANIIAAAPEMLEALDGLVKYWEWFIKDPSFKEYVDAKSAINKARGI